MIFSVIKRKRKIAGRTVSSRNYYLRYRFDAMVAPKVMSLETSCKEVAWQKANDFRREYEEEKAGLIPPRSIRKAEQKSIGAHVEDYLADLRARGRDGRKGEGARQVRNRLKRLTSECGWTSLRAINSDVLMPVQNAN